MNQNIKPYEHQNFYVETQWLGRKPQKLHYLQNLLCQIQPWLGKQPLTIYFIGEHRLRLYNWLPGTNWKGLQPLQAYNVGPSTTLPPYNDKIERRRERLKTDSVQALLTTVNIIVSKWETHFDWQTPQDNQKKDQRRLKLDTQTNIKQVDANPKSNQEDSKNKVKRLNKKGEAKPKD